MIGEGIILPDMGGVIGGLPRPSDREIRRKECPAASPETMLQTLYRAPDEPGTTSL